MPSPVEVQDAIYNYIEDNWSYTTIAYGNQDFDPTTQNLWIRPTILFTNTELGELGDDTNATGIRYGVLIINVFIPKNEGTRQGLIRATQLEALFRRASIEYVHFQEPTTTETYSEHDNYYQINVTINFHCISGTVSE